jgi:hypothetical protein
LQDLMKSWCFFNVLVFSSHSRGRIHTSLSCAFSIYFFELDLDSLVNGKGYFLRRAKPILCVGVRAVTEQSQSSHRAVTEQSQSSHRAGAFLFTPRPRDHGHNREITATGRLLFLRPFL